MKLPCLEGPGVRRDGKKEDSCASRIALRGNLTHKNIRIRESAPNDLMLPSTPIGLLNKPYLESHHNRRMLLDLVMNDLAGSLFCTGPP